MKNNKNLCEFSLTLTENPDAWIDSLRHNLFMLVERDDVSLRDLAEAADVNYDTFKGFLYGDSKNCKLGTVVGIAKAYGFTLDELVGAGTMSPRERSILQHLRMVPENIQYFIEWAVGFMHRRCIESGHRQKVVALLRPKCMFLSTSLEGDLNSPYRSAPSWTWFVSILMFSYSFMNLAIYCDIVIMFSRLSLPHLLKSCFYTVVCIFQTSSCLFVVLLGSLPAYNTSVVRMVYATVLLRNRLWCLLFPS